ncbi:hypothetical protein FRACYDRAFT_223813 [Fragilariopsis cylindrus CCMP1102]|uniref:CS domain-containing protein n=1 Tax=Fragilariopsis cylindrus CCMP1102 TaxID=635003 RepID=A0A1E7FZH8_9STRA|nr:hypothetical protein FRACYDRAFT_223813 [Fragilariopsis cylindrus CCMP1102]|eukprot:OEU23561.1 hypothetical protein FRACYDRAFT_223813 [Fragilariopsis cylindrus CCMP1102]
MSNNNKKNFKYVLVPAIDSEPISVLEASKSGGLTNDELSKNAKQYFFEKSGGSKRAKLLEAATTMEKKQIADKIREQYNASSLSGPDDASSKICAMDDEQIISLLKVQETSSACEITCLTIPTPVNGQTAVSMYGDDTARTKNLPYNVRATKLMMAAGHAFPQSATSANAGGANNIINDESNDGKQNGIYGDVFVGRCIDDEVKDIWERIDIVPAEVGGDGNTEQQLLNQIEWCKVARKKGGGGGQGGKQAASLSNTLKNFNTTMEDEDNNNDNKYTWTQTDEEVEIKFIVPNDTKSKNVQVKFGQKSLKVSLVGLDIIAAAAGISPTTIDDDGILCHGELWDDIDIDGSTFTLQNENSNRELCISLEKSNNGQTWNYVIEE